MTRRAPRHPERPWFDLTTASEFSGWSTDTIADAARSGELRGYQKDRGCPWRFHELDLEAWMRGETPPAVVIPRVARGKS